MYECIFVRQWRGSMLPGLRSLYEPQPIRYHPVGFGSPHRAEEYRTEGPPLGLNLLPIVDIGHYVWTGDGSNVSAVGAGSTDSS